MRGRLRFTVELTGLDEQRQDPRLAWLIVRPAISSKADRPALLVIQSGVSLLIRPLRSTMTRVGSCSSRHQVTSVVSPNVQIMAMPEPLSG